MVRQTKDQDGERFLVPRKTLEKRRRKMRTIPYDTSKWMKKRRCQDHVYIKTKLIDKQRVYLSRMFAIFDKDGGGSIDLSELKDALIDYGYDADEADDYLDVFAKMPSVQVSSHMRHE